MSSLGLSDKQVVVALNGYGIQNKEQFIFVWELSNTTTAAPTLSDSASPTNQLIVWDGGSYREIKVNLAGRAFDAMYQDYHR